MFSGKELVGDTGETEDVISHIRSFLHQTLAARIRRGGRRRCRPHLRSTRLRHLRLCDSKIEHAHVAVCIDHHVIGLQIEMQDTPIVRVNDRVTQLAEYASRCFERKLVRQQAPGQLSERFAIEKFHRDEICVAVMVEVEDVHDPRMGERLRLVILAP